MTVHDKRKSCKSCRLRVADDTDTHGDKALVPAHQALAPYKLYLKYKERWR
jgi:hypothetical protein